MENRKNIEGMIGNYPTLSNLIVRNIPETNANVGQFENISRHFDKSTYQYGLQTQVLNYTGMQIRILHRDHTEMLLETENVSSIYGPPKGLYVRKKFIPRSYSQLAFNMRCTRKVEPTEESQLLIELLRVHRMRQRADGMLPHAAGEPGVEFFIPLEELQMFNEPMYLPELDIIVGLANHSFEFPHPMSALTSRKEIINNIIAKELDASMNHASLSMFINDVKTGFQSRYLAVGDIIIKIEVQNNENAAEGFYVRTSNQFVAGVGVSNTEFECIDLETAHKRFMLGVTPEEALNRSLMEQNKVKRDDITMTAEEKKLRNDAIAKKNANELWYQEYTKRKDKRNEILEWFKFGISLVSSLFMIRAIIK